MTPEESLQTIRTELEAGIVLSKCQKCGCMDSRLKHLAAMLPNVGTEEASGIAVSDSASIKNMRPVQYACLGCAYCVRAAPHQAAAARFTPGRVRRDVSLPPACWGGGQRLGDDPSQRADLRRGALPAVARGRHRPPVRVAGGTVQDLGKRLRAVVAAARAGRPCRAPGPCDTLRTRARDAPGPGSRPGDRLDGPRHRNLWRNGPPMPTRARAIAPPTGWACCPRARRRRKRVHRRPWACPRIACRGFGSGSSRPWRGRLTWAGERAAQAPASRARRAGVLPIFEGAGFGLRRRWLAVSSPAGEPEVSLPLGSHYV